MTLYLLYLFYPDPHRRLEVLQNSRIQKQLLWPRTFYPRKIRVFQNFYLKWINFTLDFLYSYSVEEKGSVTKRGCGQRWSVPWRWEPERCAVRPVVRSDRSYFSSDGLVGRVMTRQSDSRVGGERPLCVFRRHWVRFRVLGRERKIVVSHSDTPPKEPPLGTGWTIRHWPHIQRGRDEDPVETSGCVNDRRYYLGKRL